eukprot:Gb_10808 [translate_table: standard]
MRNYLEDVSVMILCELIRDLWTLFKALSWFVEEPNTSNCRIQEDKEELQGFQTIEESTKTCRRKEGRFDQPLYSRIRKTNAQALQRAGCEFGVRRHLGHEHGVTSHVMEVLDLIAWHIFNKEGRSLPSVSVLFTAMGVEHGLVSMCYEEIRKQRVEHNKMGGTLGEATAIVVGEKSLRLLWPNNAK